jgi:hypothetical protein
MADPFSLASGIVGVVGLAIQVTQVVIQFGLQWKDAPKDAESFILELQSLNTNLSELHANILYNKEFSKAFQGHPSSLLSQLGPNTPSTTDAKSTLKAYTASMEVLTKKLEKRSQGHQLGWERIKGAFLAADTQKIIDNLQRQCQSFNRLVSLDAAILTAITSNEVKEARMEQRQWHNASESREILDWLSKLSFNDRQNDLFSKRHPGTAEWILKKEAFMEWRKACRDQCQTLWCPGIRESTCITNILIFN